MNLLRLSHFNQVLNINSTESRNIHFHDNFSQEMRQYNTPNKQTFLHFRSEYTIECQTFIGMYSRFYGSLVNEAEYRGPDEQDIMFLIISQHIGIWKVPH
jgi:hypothetical protein